MKKIDGQQFHQYQQNEQNHLWLNTKNETMTYDVGNIGPGTEVVKIF
jgi:hypothetical protein